MKNLSMSLMMVKVSTVMNNTYCIWLLFCHNIHKEPLTEILVYREADNLKQMYLSLPSLYKTIFGQERREINRVNKSLLNYDDSADVMSYGSSNRTMHDSDSVS